MHIAEAFAPNSSAAPASVTMACRRFIETSYRLPLEEAQLRVLRPYRSPVQLRGDGTFVRDQRLKIRLRLDLALYGRDELVQPPHTVQFLPTIQLRCVN